MDDNNVIKHIGTKRHSGRYPWGSGKDPQNSRDFLSYVKELEGQGLSEVEISKSLGIKTTELRQRKSIAKARQRADDSAFVTRLHDKGMSNVAIGKRMGINESSVRALLDPVLKERSSITKATADVLKNNVDNKGLIDIGVGSETSLGISRTKLNTAVTLLKDQGYNVYYIREQQLGTGKYTSIKVLAPPGMEYGEVSKNRANIKTIADYSEDGGRSYLGLKPVESVDGSRVKIRYGDEGGSAKDGVIELRRGVEDISLGNSKYAQVRIGVDGTHYLKGMAIYSDDLPKGVDIVYNTSKKSDVPRDSVFKEMKIDPKTGKVDQDNPFGATIKREGQKGALNIVNEEGDWRSWSKNLSSQVLSKQSPALAKKQLGLALDLKKEEFDEINSLTNPVVKKRLLESFADDCDSSAVHLQAAALPRQASHVILPITSLKQNEVYAPMYNNSENVVLIRHPHGGIFEIAEVTVNNKNKEAQGIMKGALDAVGIHPSVASKLSGADFDGDTVLVIPNKSGSIKTSPALKALKDFDTKEAYAPYDGMKTIDGGVYDAKTGKVDYGGKKPKTGPKQQEMGNVSNLITDMTIKGASTDEIARAVKHSMVVIDAEKHHLDYKRSAIENGIAELKKTYQPEGKHGAATLISRASSEKRVDFRTEGKKITDPKTGKTKRVYIDPKTGEKLYEYEPQTFVNKKGQVVRRTTKSTKLAEAKSAFELSSGTLMESIYAQHADSLKALGNKARLALLNTPNLKYSPSAKKTYADAVASLKKKLTLAIQNKPLERQAQLAANKVYRAKKEANPFMDESEKKRLRGQALTEARARIGAKKTLINITDHEWNAIQAGAVSHNVASQIILNTDLDALKVRSTPRTAYKMTPTKVSRAKTMIAAGYTPAEVASALGVSTTTIVDTVS